MNKMSVRDLDLKGKRVLVRVDFNVPLDDGAITDDTRIRAAVPTIEHILSQNPRSIILMSHLGRPKGERNPSMSLAPVAPALAMLLNKAVAFVDDCIGDKVKDAIAGLPESGIILLENTRYYKGEEKNDPELAAGLADLGDVFVNDAFGTAHRAHSSNVGISERITAVSGLLMEREIDYLSNAIEQPERPFIAILGGAKVSDKIKVIESLLNKCDMLLIGGGMANTFAKAEGYELGESLVEADAIETAKSLLQHANKLLLPVDAIIADKFDNDAQTRVISIADGVPPGWRILDIGPETLKQFETALSDAKTVVWNGPMGVFEMSNFAQGTFGVARLLSELTQQGGTTIIGGGDSAAAVEQAGLAEKMTHISTGGGASLEMLEGQQLPGVVALKDR